MTYEGRPCKRAGHTLRYQNGSCVVCHREYVRRTYDRQAHRRLLYGISLADYTRMLAAQSGGCAICSRRTHGGRGKMFHVDHDHLTGQVRGLLCHFCNLGLGHFDDDPVRLESAIRFLFRHKR